MYIARVTICGASTGMVEPEPKAFDKGLIFVKVTDILLSGDKWTIVVNIALDDYDIFVYIMKVTIGLAKRYGCRRTQSYILLIYTGMK